MTTTLPNFVTALGSKMTSFKKISALLVLLLISSLSFGQNAIVGTGFSTGWGGGSCPTGNSNFKYLSLITGANGTGTYGVTTAANGTGNQYMRFGIDWSTTNGQYAINPGTDTAILPNTSYNLNIGCTVSGSQFINVGSTSYNYVFKTFNAGTNPTGTFAFFEVQGAVQSVSSVTQSPVAASVVPSSNVTVTANLSGSLSTGQAVYLRYTNNGFSTSTVVQMTGSSTTYTAQIPSSMNGQNKTVAYYVFTSGNSLNSANSGATGVYANGNNADLFTINLNNNGGSNYSYTVANSPVIVNATTGTVGPTGYATFAAAVTAINAGTHTGVVTVSIVGATTEGTANIPINASGSGSASYTSITVRPAGGAQTLTAATAAGAAFITFNGADNVTFDGLNTNGNSLTISNTKVSATSGSCTLSFIGDATSNTVTNCTILGSTSMAADTNGGNIFFGAGAVSVGNDNNTISNCNIGPAGANLPTKAIHFGGTSNALNNSGIVINNNNIYDYFGAAVESAGIYITTGTQDASITNNRFYQTASRTQTTASLHSGIKILNLTSAGLYTISGNTIGYASSTGTGSYTLVGIAGTLFNPINLTVGTTTATSIQGNTIKAIAMSGAASGTSTSSPFIGIYVASGLSTIGDVTANTIGDMAATGSITYTSSSTSASDVIGMYNFGSSNWTTNNNNIGGITVSNSSTGAVGFYGLRCNTGSGVTWTCNNNIIGGSVAFSLDNTKAATGSSSNGILNSNPIGTFTGNLIRNMRVAGGTGTGTSSSMIGLRIDATSAQTVSQNQIYNLTNSNSGATAVTVLGIRNASTATNTFSKNLIYNFGVATSVVSNLTGIEFTGTYGTNTVSNNMIRMGYDATGAVLAGGHALNGIFVSASGATNNFYFNSVYVGGTGVTGTTATYAFNNTSTGTRIIRNNIFSNARSNGTGTGKHYAIKEGSTTGLTINYNDYFANGTGGVLGILTSDRATLSAWQTATTQDANSQNGDPQFIAPTSATPDLHIHATNPTPIEGTGIVIAAVTDDYDGQTRSGLTPTDMGADAGNFTPITPTIALSTNSVAAGNLTQNTTVPIYSFGIAVTTASANLTGLSITTTGTYALADVTSFNVYYQTTASWTGSGTLLSTYTNLGGATTITFPSFVSQSISNGTTGYIFIAAVVPCSATATRTVIVSAVTASNTTFAAGSPSGTPAAGNTQTVPSLTLNNVTSPAASILNASSSVSWVNPTGCFDEILIVARAGSANDGIPTGNGTAYTGNLAFGSGTALGSGFVVYEGPTTPQTVTTLTNGTTYFYKFFTRSGTTWSSGIEISAIPGLVYCTSTGPASQGSDYFTSVNVTVSGVGITNTASGYSTNGYGNFTAQSVTQVQGGTVNYSLTSPGVADGSSFGIFVDWNQDGDFLDANEQPLLTTTQPVTNPTGTFSVPVGAILGNTRMRVVVKDATGSVNSCNTTTANSETEDYTFIVTAPCTQPTTQATIGSYTANTTGTSLTVNWTRGNGTGGVIVVARATATSNVLPTGGTTYTPSTVGAFGGTTTTGTGNIVVYNGTGTTVDVTGLTAGTSYTFSVYEFNSTSNCYNTSASSSAVTTCTSGTPSVAITVTTGANPTCTGSSVTFTATPTNGGTPTYQWKLNGTNVGTSSTTYTNAALANGDQVSCVLTNAAACTTTATSNTITMTVTAAPTTSNAGTGQSICVGAGAVTLAANTPTVGTGTWSVSGPSTLTSQFSNVNSPTATFTPAGGTGAYVLTWTITSGGCSSASTVTITVNAAPAAVTITPSTTTCPNVITTLTASSASIGTYTVGTSSGSSAAANTPYRQGVTTQARMQYLITKAEMNAAGINSAANLTSLGFNVTTAGSGTMSNYTISMTNTNLTVLTATYQTPTFTTVFSGTNILPVSGINTHTFSSPFAWDGTSNILINICHQGAGGTTATVSIVTPTNVSTTSGAGSNQCNLTTGGATNASRPVMIFGVAGQITWAPTTDLYTDSGATTSYSGGAAVTVYTKPTATRTYTATASLGSCTITNTSTITTKIPVGITSVTAGASPICSTATTSLTANGVVGTNNTVTWYTGTGGTGTNLGTGLTLSNVGPGTYYALVTGDCDSPAEASVTVAAKVNVGITSATAAASPICAVATTTLTANGVVGDGAVVTWYTGSGATGTNLGTGSTLTAGPGTYYAYVTGDCGTPAEATVTVGTKVNVAITSVTAASNPICSSATTLLTANGVVGDGAIVTWYTGSGATGTNLGTGVTTTKGPGTYYARVTGDCGTAEANFTINAIAEPTWANLQWPPTGAICQTGSYTAYGQVYQSGVTDSAGQGSGITVQFGYNGTDTDPSTWTSWSAASYNVDSGNNDEYLYTFTPPSSGTFYYTFRYKQGTCDWKYGGYSSGGGGAWSGSNVSGILTVTASPSAGTLGGSQAVCISDSTTFTSTSSDGSWSSSDTGVASIDATTGVVTPVAAGTATMTYTVTGTGGCSNATNTRTVTVNQVTNGGTASSNQIICSGETPSAITLASSVGSVVKWQSSSDAAFTSPTDITNTSTTLTLGSLSATTYYRAVVQSGACSSANSNVVTITVNSLPTVSIASNNSPVCSGAASFSLTGTTDAVVTYNINGGTNATTTLTGGAATISVPNPFASQVLTLVSVANNGCTSSLSDTSTVSVIATTYDGTSWSNGNPDSSKLAIFTGNYTIAADLTACSLRVTNNAVVTVNSNYNVYLNGAITVDSGSSFTMNNNTNLLQSDASAVNTGNIIVKRNTSTIVRLDHTLWSSPVTGQNLFSFSPNTLVNRFYVYNTATNSYVTTGLSNTSLFTPAKGFAVRAPNNQSATTPAVWTGTFTGVPNNGTKTFTLATNAANGYNYNLVGNPYPSAISASNFYAANASKIGGTLYFYAHTLTMNASGIFPIGTNYATWTGLGGAAATAGDGHTPAVAPNGIIQVGQGFIVRATASGDVTFTNAMRVANQQNQFMKAATASAETHRMWLNLKTDTGVDINQILVGYMDGATQGVDAGLDGLSFGNTGSYLYSKIENDNFVIQARSLPFDVTDEVPLGFNCATAGSYSISLTNTDGLFAADQDILVRDNLTGTDTSIKTVPYTFNSETGVFDTRFRLVYTQALGVPSTNFTENSVIVYKNTDWFHVNTKGIEMKDIMVYDISGRLIYSKKDINATTAVLNGLTTTNQVLILKINSIEDKTVTIKVIN